MEPVIAVERSLWSNRFGVLCYYDFNIHFFLSVMHTQEVSVCFEGFREVHLKFMFCILLFNFDIRDDGGAEIVEYGPRPDFLLNILVLFRVKRIETQGGFEVAKSGFLTLYECSYKM